MLDEGNTTISRSKSIEALQLILEHEQSRSIVYEEAFDIGESLLTFFEILAESDDNGQ